MNSTNLLSALKFVSLCQLDAGSPIQVHCQIKNKKIVASNTILSIGCNIEDDIESCPQTNKLISALSKCGQDQALTVEQGKITVKSGKFSANIACYPDALPEITPNPNIAVISNDLRAGFEQISHIVDNKDNSGDRKIYKESILIEKDILTTTTGFVALQYYHGIDLPKVTVPKVFANAVCDIDKNIVGFGFSHNSITFWFEDESWIKTQTFAEEWPNTEKMFAQWSNNMKPLPEDLYNILNIVEDFAEGKEKDQVVRFTDKGIKTDNAFYEFEGLPEAAFKIKQLKQIKNCVKTIDFNMNPTPFLSDKIRGVIMQVRY